MGNVHAANAAPRPSMGFQSPPMSLPQDEPKNTPTRSSMSFQTSPISLPEDDSPIAPSISRLLGNPGTMEDLHKICKGKFRLNLKLFILNFLI
jgi:hypothetical protein